jgi:Sulfotransferase domain
MTKTVLKISRPTAWAMLRNFIDWREQGRVKEMMRQEMNGLFGPGGMNEVNMKRIFNEYHENLRRIVPQERLLEFKVQDGYKPLCDFLEVPVPTTVIDEKQMEEAFPRVNEGAVFVDRLVIMRRRQNKRIMKKAGTLVTIIALIGAGLWYLRRR